LLDKSKNFSLGPNVPYGSLPERKLLLALNSVKFWSFSIDPERLPWSLLFCKLTNSNEVSLLIVASGNVEEKIFEERSKAVKRGQLPNHALIDPTSRLLDTRKVLILVRAGPMDDGMLPTKRLLPIPKFSSRVSEEIDAGRVPRSLFPCIYKLVRLVKELPTKSGMVLVS